MAADTYIQASGSDWATNKLPFSNLPWTIPGGYTGFPPYPSNDQMLDYLNAHTTIKRNKAGFLHYDQSTEETVIIVPRLQNLYNNSKYKNVIDTEFSFFIPPTQLEDLAEDFTPPPDGVFITYPNGRIDDASRIIYFMEARKKRWIPNWQTVQVMLRERNAQFNSIQILELYEIGFTPDGPDIQNRANEWTQYHPEETGYNQLAPNDPGNQDIVQSLRTKFENKMVTWDSGQFIMGYMDKWIPGFMQLENTSDPNATDETYYYRGEAPALRETDGANRLDKQLRTNIVQNTYIMMNGKFRLLPYEYVQSGWLDTTPPSAGTPASVNEIWDTTDWRRAIYRIPDRALYLSNQHPNPPKGILWKSNKLAWFKTSLGTGWSDNLFSGNNAREVAIWNEIHDFAVNDTPIANEAGTLTSGPTSLGYPAPPNTYWPWRDWIDWADPTIQNIDATAGGTPQSKDVWMLDAPTFKNWLDIYQLCATYNGFIHFATPYLSQGGGAGYVNRPPQQYKVDISMQYGKYQLQGPSQGVVAPGALYTDPNALEIIGTAIQILPRNTLDPNIVRATYGESTYDRLFRNPMFDSKGKIMGYEDFQPLTLSEYQTYLDGGDPLAKEELQPYFPMGHYIYYPTVDGQPSRKGIKITPRPDEPLLTGNGVDNMPLDSQGRQKYGTLYIEKKQNLWIKMFDSYGDGWNGNKMYFNGIEVATLDGSNDSVGSVTFPATDDTSYDIRVGGGSWLMEIRWEIWGGATIEDQTWDAQNILVPQYDSVKRERAFQQINLIDSTKMSNVDTSIFYGPDGVPGGNAQSFGGPSGPTGESYSGPPLVVGNVGNDGDPNESPTGNPNEFNNLPYDLQYDPGDPTIPIWSIHGTGDLMNSQGDPFTKDSDAEIQVKNPIDWDLGAGASRGKLKPLDMEEAERDMVIMANTVWNTWDPVAGQSADQFSGGADLDDNLDNDTEVFIEGGDTGDGTPVLIGNLTGTISDIRLKENIIKIGNSAKMNIPIYEFNYLNNKEIRYRGAMAQDLLKTKNESAVVKLETGYYAIDYNKIDVEFTQINTYD